MFISLVGIFITIFFVIGTHEAAHFVAARLLGVKVLRFSIGFGKQLFSWTDKSGTEYIVACIPLGGYVKMLDENEGEVPKSLVPFAYNRQPFYKKFAIVLAGPLTNLICAFLLYWLVFMIGFTTIRPIIGTVAPRSIAVEAGLLPHQEITQVDGKMTTSWTGILFRLITHTGNHDHLTMTIKTPGATTTETRVLDLSNFHLNALNPDPLNSIGIMPYEPPIPLIIGHIKPDSPAAHQLQLGDQIKTINHLHITNWNDVVLTIVNHPSQTLLFTVVRGGKTIDIPVAIGYQRNWRFKESGYLGIGPSFEWPKELLKDVKYNPLQAFAPAWQEVSDLTYFNLIIFGKMITGKLSLQSLGGPITIFGSAGNALNYGFLPFISFLAFLSLSIGIINFFPIPGLDGGHMFMQLLELIIRRPVPERVQIVLYRCGFLFIFFIFIQALMNDFLRLW